MDTERGQSPRLPIWIVLLIMGIAGGWGALRGPALAIRGGGDDFALIYISARAWLFGQNPYNGLELDELWNQAGGSESLAPTVRGPNDLLYPPFSFPLLAPVAALPWPAASLLWMLLNVGAFGLGLIALLRWSGAPPTLRHPMTLAIVAIALLFGPVHTGIRMGQTTLIVFACLCAAHAIRVGARTDRQILPGLLLAIAAVIKPQIGVPFLIYEMFARRWWSAGIGVGVASAVAVIALVRLAIAEVEWPPLLQENLRIFTTTGAGNPLPDNPYRYQMIDLQVLSFLTPFPPRVFALLGTGAIALLGAIAWLRAREGRRELLAVSLGVGLCLLVVYHRYYDAALLLIPAAWAITAVWGLADTAHRRAPILLLGAIAPFALPGGALLYLTAQRDILPASVTGAPWWNNVIMLHQAWLIPIITLIIIAMLWRTRSENRIEPKRPS